MRVELAYMCTKCHKAYGFDSQQLNNDEIICPVCICGAKLYYWITSEVDEDTGKVIRSYRDPKREQANPYYSSVMVNPKIECPYCHSTNTKKISATSKAINTAVFGIFGTKRHKQWHCNKCDSDF